MVDYRQTGYGTPASTAGAAMDLGLRSYMLGVYNYMALGLVVTAAAAYGLFSASFVEANGQIVGLTSLGATIFTGPLMWVLMLAPFAFVLVLSFGINRMSKSTAQLVFWLFAAAMGASMSNIFLLYTGQSIASTFFITSAMFAGVSLYGYTTKADLTKMGSFMMMGLIGIIIASLVNMFLQSGAMAFAISVIGVVVFVGLTAYDTQRIKADYIAYSYAEGTEQAGKRSVMDALALYLNFVNLFQMLLTFIGQREE